MRIAGAKIAITLCVVLSAAVCAAQSLGDVARQERARKSHLTQHAVVVTNDNLQQEKILSAASAEEQPVVSQLPATLEVTPNSVPAEPPSIAFVSANTPRWEVADQPGFSLGAYARALRQERIRRDQKHAAMNQAAEKITNETLAEILPPAGEVKRPAENQKNENQPAQPPATEVQVETVQPIVPKQQPTIETGRPLIRASRGDSLWKLAKVHLGDGRLWPVLWESNPEIRNPQRLVIGQLLRLPVQELNFARVKMNHKQVKVITAKRNTVQPSTTIQTAGVTPSSPASSVRTFDVVSYLPARLSTWAVAGLATFVKPSAYPTR